jgi:lysophospholipase L1-like esterase
MEQIRHLLQRAEPVKWLFTGDSITHGAAHTFGWRDYTELFSERVRYELRRTRDIVIKTAADGWTIQRIADDLRWNVLQFSPDCVSIMIGMNDCKAGPDGLNRFQETYTETITRIRRESHAAILLHTPNWLLPTDGEVRRRNLPAYVEVIRQIAREVDAPLIDHFAIWLRAAPSGTMHHWIAHGCHPNEYGHRVFARAIFRALDIWDDQSWTCQLNVP